jgi:2-keto-4-pentenoate hydratase/2-oxohepta-3-ene-1,7-dioic acid hydratase in catechol pathway
VLGIVQDWRRASDRIASAVKGGTAKGSPLSQTHLRTAVDVPGALYCAGANYRDHAIEMATKLKRPLDPDPKESGGKPWHFLKPGRCATDPGVTVTATHLTKKLDWEIELAGVIGVEAKGSRSKGRSIMSPAIRWRTMCRRATWRDARKWRPGRPSISIGWGRRCFDGSCPIGTVDRARGRHCRPAESEAETLGQRRHQAGFQHERDDLHAGRSRLRICPRT